jgi:hypothetical protein
MRRELVGEVGWEGSSVVDVTGVWRNSEGKDVCETQIVSGRNRSNLFFNVFSDQTTRPCSFVCEFMSDPVNANAKVATISIFAVPFALKPKPGRQEFITRHNAGCGIIYFDAA